MLNLINATDMGMVLTAREALHPDKPAFSFYDSEFNPLTISYSELAKSARRIAGALVARLKSQDRVLLVLPPGDLFLSAFIGSIYAGTIAVPTAVPKVVRSLDIAMMRLAVVVRSCDAQLALASSHLIEQLRNISNPEVAAIVASLDWLSIEEALQYKPVEPVAAREDDIAFLQYTSGSTGNPKGVIVTHANMMANEAQIQKAFGVTQTSNVVSWLPHHHDMGLIGGLLQPLYIGSQGFVISPESFVRRPLRWLKLISDTGAAASGGPNFAYDLCVRQIRDEDLETLDLSRWEVAFCGAEPIQAAVLESFIIRFARCGFNAKAFLPCYGLAEATLLVTGGPAKQGLQISSLKIEDLTQEKLTLACQSESATRVVACGQAADDVELYIADVRTGHALPEGKIGEIWVTGPNVSSGYWNNPSATQDTYVFVSERSGRRFLKTGDLGGIIDGQLIITGRSKELIILNGHNLFPSDIECIACSEDPRFSPSGAVAFSAKFDGREELVLALEFNKKISKPSFEIEPLAQRIAMRLLQDFGMAPREILFLQPRTIGRTTSGKLQRVEFRTSYSKGQVKPYFTWRLKTDLESSSSSALSHELEQSHPIVQRVLLISRRILQCPQLQADASLLMAGCDSIKAMQLLTEIETYYSVTLDLASFSQCLSAIAIAERIEQLLFEKLLSLSDEDALRELSREA